MLKSTKLIFCWDACTASQQIAATASQQMASQQMAATASQQTASRIPSCELPLPIAKRMSSTHILVKTAKILQTGAPLRVLIMHREFSAAYAKSLGVVGCPYLYEINEHACPSESEHHSRQLYLNAIIRGNGAMINRPGATAPSQQQSPSTVQPARQTVLQTISEEE